MPFDLDAIKYATLPTFLAYTAGSALSGRISWPPDCLGPVRAMCRPGHLQHFPLAFVTCAAACVVEKQVSRARHVSKLWKLPIVVLMVITCASSVVFPNVGNVLADTARITLDIYVVTKLISFIDYRNRLRRNAGDVVGFVEGNIVQMFWPFIGPWMSYRPSQRRKIRWKPFVRGVALLFLCPCVLKVLISGWANYLIRKETSLPMPVKHMARTLLLSHPMLYISACLFLLIFEGVDVVFGELSGTTDTTYYLDWYNARTPRGFWQKWNLPVHRFLTRYTYVPAIRAGLPKIVAAEITFATSALLHEYVLYFVVGPKFFMFTFVFLFQPLVFEPSDLVDRYSKFASHCLIKSFVLLSFTSFLVAYQ